MRPIMMLSWNGVSSIATRRAEYVYWTAWNTRLAKFIELYA